jgi:site-specific DNA recombinase
METTHETTRLTAAAYLRVSTRHQACASGLHRQRDSVREYADAHGLEIVGAYIDVTSGVEAFRPGLRDLLDLVDAGAVDVVLVEEPSRLSRDAAHTGALMDRLDRAGVLVQETCPLWRTFEEELHEIFDRAVAAAVRER